MSLLTFPSSLRWFLGWAFEAQCSSSSCWLAAGAHHGEAEKSTPLGQSRRAHLTTRQCKRSRLAPAPSLLLHQVRSGHAACLHAPPRTPLPLPSSRSHLLGCGLVHFCPPSTHHHRGMAPTSPALLACIPTLILNRGGIITAARHAPPPLHPVSTMCLPVPARLDHLPPTLFPRCNSAYKGQRGAPQLPCPPRSSSKKNELANKNRD